MGTRVSPSGAAFPNRLALISTHRKSRSDVKDLSVLMAELNRIRQEFELKHHRKPTAEEIRILELAEHLLRERQQRE
jgi:hypothetical protein